MNFSQRPLKSVSDRTLVFTEKQEGFLNSFFKNCPDSFCRSVTYRVYEAGSTIISTDGTCSQVYILLSGRLQGVEERIHSMNYCFTEIEPVDIIGDYELFTDNAQRIITLKTLEPALCLVIPAKEYLAWIRTDADALFLRIQMLLRQIISQTTFERQNFFFSNRERFLLFVYRECILQTQENSGFRIPLTHNEIASRLGCSVRTVNRLISSLSQEELLSFRHGKIRISRQQLEKIRETVQTEILPDF